MALNVRANQALSDTPRENFVPEEYQKLVFADIEIPLNELDKMFSPKIEGRILDSLNLQGNEDILRGWDWKWLLNIGSSKTIKLSDKL